MADSGRANLGRVEQVSGVDVEDRIANDHKRFHDGSGRSRTSSTAMHSPWMSNRWTSCTVAVARASTLTYS